MVSDLAKFLMVLTEKSTNVSIQYKIIKQLETHNVYSSFITEILLQDESQEFFHHGLTILRETLHSNPQEVSRILVLIEESSSHQCSPLDLIQQRMLELIQIQDPSPE